MTVWYCTICHEEQEQDRPPKGCGNCKADAKSMIPVGYGDWGRTKVTTFNNY